MKRYTVAHLRERLSDALDEAERGVPVIIERRGVRYRLSVDRKGSATKKRRPRIEILDPAVESGGWTWDWTPKGLSFKSTRPK